MSAPDRIWVIQWPDGRLMLPATTEKEAKNFNSGGGNEGKIYEYHLAPAWVSVEDRLPEIDVDVLLVDANGHRTIGRYTEANCEDMFGNPYDYMTFDDNYENEVAATHWMPLPSPPEDTDG